MMVIPPVLRCARFLGNLDWAQQGRLHDALLVRHTLSPLRITIDAAMTWNQAGFAEPGRLTDNFYSLGAANNKTMQFLWVNKQYDEAAVSVLLHNDGRQLADESMAWMQTDTMNTIKGAMNPQAHQSWAFVMLRIAPRVFSSRI